MLLNRFSLVSAKHQVSYVMLLEQKTMSYIPIFLLAFLKLSSRDYMSALYGNLIGGIFMSTCLLAYAGAIKLAKKFLQVGIGI